MADNTQNDARPVMVGQEEPAVCSPALATDRTATPPAVDPEAEWDQRILAGLKRMDTDPVFREAVRRRTH